MTSIARFSYKDPASLPHKMAESTLIVAVGCAMNGLRPVLSLDRDLRS